MINCKYFTKINVIAWRVGFSFFKMQIKSTQENVHPTTAKIPTKKKQQTKKSAQIKIRMWPNWNVLNWNALYRRRCNHCAKIRFDNTALVWHMGNTHQGLGNPCSISTLRSESESIFDVHCKPTSERARETEGEKKRKSNTRMNERNVSRIVFQLIFNCIRCAPTNYDCLIRSGWNIENTNWIIVE